MHGFQRCLRKYFVSLMACAPIEYSKWQNKSSPSINRTANFVTKVYFANGFHHFLFRFFFFRYHFTFVLLFWCFTRISDLKVMFILQVVEKGRLFISWTNSNFYFPGFLFNLELLPVTKGNFKQKLTHFLTAKLFDVEKLVSTFN